ncbi:hypothetical protein [Gloeobacter kilaueensis]|uniref:hypothetical protein n=1 Tax=Gloeobacter kilaueensis TaxID=1416614 RepID=UPI001182C3F0|nr:hypothetical protein [Gloeobacter kilaueensis]
MLWLIEGIISKARLHILGLSAPMFLPGLLLVYVCGRNVPRLWRVSREVLKEDARFDWSNLDFGAALRAFFTRPEGTQKPVHRNRRRPSNSEWTATVSRLGKAQGFGGKNQVDTGLPK